MKLRCDELKAHYVDNTRRQAGRAELILPPEGKNGYLKAQTAVRQGSVRKPGRKVKVRGKGIDKLNPLQHHAMLEIFAEDHWDLVQMGGSPNLSIIVGQPIVTYTTPGFQDRETGQIINFKGRV